MSDERLKRQMMAVQMTTIGLSQLLIYANERIEELENEVAKLRAVAAKTQKTPVNDH